MRHVGLLASDAAASCARGLYVDSPVSPTLATETLRLYESICTKLKAEEVRSVYPKAPIDQLAKEFAGYRAYGVIIHPDDFKFTTAAHLRVSVPSHVVYDIVPKVGPSKKIEVSQTFVLEKPGDTWIIVDIQQQ